ncbi:hypothetical protein GDN83_00885 [Gordonia jinghuaiqii]|uniref:PEP-utilising enzyme mobile domain-containing protein n=1 Tax=Gordonia jinghuaiqii TaxID=2758710 RepID=A0A7D7R0J0_9ACTN|nr:hypothetical protein [Gordonia jinghuaiqii]QMT03549.1 hypothetical protein H1R19_10960 [Gordonia jinghuaiqii]
MSMRMSPLLSAWSPSTASRVTMRRRASTGDWWRNNSSRSFLTQFFCRRRFSSSGSRASVPARELSKTNFIKALHTDPGWTPLFATCAGVVVNVGSPLSHAAIVSRELGIPAVLAVEQATKRIKSGMLLTVDGTTGTVTVH